MADFVVTAGLDAAQTLKGLDQIGDKFDKLEKDAKGNVEAIRKALVLMASEGQDGTDAFRQMVGELGKAEAEAQRLADAQALVDRATGRAALSAQDLKDNLARMVREGQKGTAEFENMRAALRSNMAEAQALAESMAEVEDLAAGIGKELENSGKGGLDKLKGSLSSLKDAAGSGGPIGALNSGLSMLGPKGAAVAAGLAAVAAVSTKAVQAAREFEAAQREVAIATGLSGDGLEDLADAARNAYIGGVGESAAEALKTVGQLRTTLGDKVPTDALDEAARAAGQVAKSLGIETPELVAKFSPLIKQYGLDFQDALNLAASAAQNGVSDVGGYLDAIQEFTPNAKEAGLSAEEFAGRLGKAAQVGVKDLAKVGDGYKELNNRIKSGDLSVQVGAIGGAVGQQLQELARLAETGAITADEAGQKMVGLLDEAAKNGEISARTQGQALTAIYGSIAEDLGTEVTTKIYGGKVDVAAVKANAAKVGKTIQDGLAKQDPFEKLKRSVDVFLAAAGGPILAAFNEIGDLINEIFGGVENSGDGIENFGKTVGEVVAFATVNLRALLKVVAEVAGAIRGASDFLGDLFGGDSNQKKLDDQNKAAQAAQEKQKKNAQALVAEAAALARTNGLNAEAVQALADKYGVTVEEAQRLVAKSEDVGKAAKAAAVDINTLAAGFQNAQAAAEQAVATYTSGIAQLRIDIAAARKAGDKELTAQLEATLEKSLEEQRQNRSKARTLNRQADAADLAGNTERQNALTLANRTAELNRDAEAARRAAARIVDAREQARALLEVDQNLRRDLLAAQVKYADTTTVEARKARTQLEKDLATLTATDQNERRALEGQFLVEDVERTLETEAARTQAVADGEARRLEIVQRSIERRGAANAELVEAEAAAQERLARVTAEQTARAYVEGLQEFQLARTKILAAVQAEQITKDEAVAQIAGLYTTIGQRLKTDALAGGDELARGYLAIFDRLDDQVEDLTRNTSRRLARLGVEADQDLFRRSARLAVLDAEQEYKDRVKAANGNLALELLAWREFLQARADLEADYLAQTSEAYRAAVDFRANLETAFTGLFSAEQDAKANAAADAYRKQLEALEAALAAGTITWGQYREQAAKAAEGAAQDQAGVLEKMGQGFLDAINRTVGTALENRAEKARAEADRQFLIYRDNETRIQDLEERKTQAALAEIQARTEGRLDDAAGFMEQYNDLTAEQTLVQQDQADVIDNALGSIATSAAANFGKLVVEGKNAWKSLVTVALDALQSLVPILVAQIFGVQVASPNPANALSFGSAGTIAAAALTAVLQGLVSIAKSSLNLNRGAVGLGEYDRVDLWPGQYGFGVDSIPANLDWGESVIPRKGTRARGRLGSNADLFRYIVRTNRPWEDYLADQVSRGQLNTDLLLESLGITFADAVDRGAGAALVVERQVVVAPDTRRLEALVAAQTEALATLEKKVLQRVEIVVTPEADPSGIFATVEAAQARRSHHIG